MKFEVTHTYRHPADDVFAALTDFECVRQKYKALGHTGIELLEREESEDGGLRLATRRIVPLELPGFASRVLSPRQSVTQTDEWSAIDGHGGRTGTFDVVTKGTPVHVRGTLRLAPDGKRRCTMTIAAAVECSLPLIGGKIAGFVAGDARRAVDHEQTWIAEHLAAR